MLDGQRLQKPFQRRLLKVVEMLPVQASLATQSTFSLLLNFKNIKDTNTLLSLPLPAPPPTIMTFYLSKATISEADSMIRHLHMPSVSRSADNGRVLFPCFNKMGPGEQEEIIQFYVADLMDDFDDPGMTFTIVHSAEGLAVGFCGWTTSEWRPNRPRPIPARRPPRATRVPQSLDTESINQDTNYFDCMRDWSVQHHNNVARTCRSPSHSALLVSLLANIVLLLGNQAYCGWPWRRSTSARAPGAKCWAASPRACSAAVCSARCWRRRRRCHCSAAMASCRPVYLRWGTSLMRE